MSKLWKSLGAVALGVALSTVAGAQIAPQTVTDDGVVVVQSRGVDPSVHYAALTKFGPWDDRNYQMTAEDVARLPANDHDVPVPAFFRSIKRKEMIEQGFPLGDFYPREFNKEFQLRYGGLMRNGVIERKGLGVIPKVDPNNPPIWATDPLPKAVPVIGEGPFDGTSSTNETTIEYNPVNPLKIIAGSNSSGQGQRQAFSLDGGATWMAAGTLPGTCCDPALDWSPDGTIAYAATLGAAGSGCTFSLCSSIYFSTNDGATWQGPIHVSTASSDKEFIHVDKTPGSPFLGRVYVTWHQGNVMQFTRSTSQSPLAFAPATSFAAEERGIGSDITTDHLGNVYHFFPTLTAGSTEIRVIRSFDGGVTHQPSVVVAPLRGRFEFALPSMETRRGFIYAAADADTSNGPRRGRVYVTWSDVTPNTVFNAGDPNANHAWVRVAYSDDQGATWTIATPPHATADELTVDRYHPWIDVDQYGAVHLGFYDTRNSSGRSGVDWYYVISLDGGNSWIEETRVTAATSVNITNGQEWGDYNGLSASSTDRIGMTWTDNRVVGASPLQRSFAGFVTNIGAGPSFSVDAGAAVAACAGSPLPARTINVGSILGYNNDVTLSLPGLDAAVFPTATFGTNPVTPPGSSSLAMTTAAAAPAGNYTVTVRGEGAPETALGSNIVRDATFQVRLDNPLAGAPVPSTPANGATGTALRPTLTWSAVAGVVNYTVEIATDAAFTTIVASGTPTGTSFQPAAPLAGGVQHFWRVRANNGCGSSAFSSTFSFTTANLVCATPNLAIPDNNPTGVSSNIVINSGGVINNLSVIARGTHTWVGDLTIRLSNGATTIELMNRPGVPTSTFGCSGDNFDVTFSQAGTGDVETTCLTPAPAIAGTLIPNPGNLNAFNGVNANGTWTMTILDSAGSDTGTFAEWCMAVPAGGGSFFTVTPVVVGNGTITPNTPQSVASGTTTSFTVTPAANHNIQSVTGCGGTLVGNTYTTGAITANCTVTATFAINTYAVTPSAGANGTISPATVQNIAHGSTTTFTVTPNNGYQAAVTGCGGTLVGQTYTTGPITAACAVDATFTLRPDPLFSNGFED